jgi:anaerobic magnesium-protoporphyrin IX monomethyl ester cyclase
MEQTGMKLVFVQPNVGFKGHTWEALGIGYIIAYVRKHFPGDLDVTFLSAFFESDGEIVARCCDADIIGFTCTSPQYKHARALARQVKRKDNIVVFGGVHPSALPDDVIAEDCVDVVVKGEGEQATLNLLNDVTAGRPLKSIYHADFIADIDAIPFPDRKTIRNERNIEQAYKDNNVRITSVLSSRGCPFLCGFCCSQVVWQRNVRTRSPDNILDEVGELVNDWNIQFFKFADDTFTINKKRVIDFCNIKRERGLDVPYGANAHINTVDEKMLRHLVDSNCKELWFGVESGSPKILKDMHKNTSIGHIRDVFKMCKKYDIKTRAYFLLGMPNETIEDIRMTEALCEEIQPDIVGFTLLAPYPDNEFYDHATMKDWDWSTFDEYNNGWVKTKTLSNQDLKREQIRLVEKYQNHITFRQKED